MREEANAAFSENIVVVLEMIWWTNAPKYCLDSSKISKYLL